MSESEKCAVTEGRLVEPCKALSDSCEFGNPCGKQKGMWMWEYYNVNRPFGEGPTRRFFGAKSGDFVQKGVAFHYCPFCGTRIDAPFEQPSNG